jgi:hypothetical protein
MSMRYERRFYTTRSGLNKARKRWRESIIHWFECNNGWILCRRLS